MQKDNDINQYALNDKKLILGPLKELCNSDPIISCLPRMPICNMGVWN